MTTAAQDIPWMQAALELARQGIFSTAPNPRVGCVIVKGGEAIGKGFHVRAGEPHAEAHALREAGAAARGATAYVSLEPCAHQGRTPPCADALIAAGVARVVVACRDPNPLVAGQGIARLQAAGIDVTEGVCEEEAQALNSGFFRRITTGRPFVTVKLAASLDGKTALANGESQWITSEAARAASLVIHWLSPLASAVLPSSEAASLTVTNGRPVVMRRKKPLLSACASSSQTPSVTSIPAACRRAMPCPATSGLGSRQATTTRATPAAISASAQGGVRP